jgi:hypothetical protein
MPPSSSLTVPMPVIYPLPAAALSRSLHNSSLVFSNGSSSCTALSFRDGDHGNEDMLEETGDHEVMMKRQRNAHGIEVGYDHKDKFPLIFSHGFHTTFHDGEIDSD